MDLRGCIFLVLLSLPTILSGQAVSEGSESVGFRNLLVEPSILISSAENNKVSSQQIIAPTTLFRYGISDEVELRAQSQYEILNGEVNKKGLGDLFLGVKYQFDYNEDRNSQLALMSTFLVPLRMHGLSNDRFGMINTIILQKDFSNDYSLLVNLSHSYMGEWRGDINYSFLVTKALNDRVSLYVEPFGDLENLEDLVASIDAGLSYTVSNNLGLDITYGTGLNHKMNFISVGASILLITDRLE